MVYSANPISKEQLQRAIEAQLEESGLPTDEQELIDFISEHGGGSGGNGELFLPFNPSSSDDQYQLTPLIPIGYKLLGADTGPGKSNEQMITNAGIAGATLFYTEILYACFDSNFELVLSSIMASSPFSPLNVDLSPDTLLAETSLGVD